MAGTFHAGATVTNYAFGARLRHERERRGIDLATIADRTKIAPILLVALERGDVTRWPGGIYRRSFIRAYAEAVGLDPAEVAQEFFEHFPAPAIDPISGAPTQPAPGAVAPSATTSAVRVRIDQPPDVSRGGTVLSDARQRLGAIAADLAILGAIAMGLSVALGDFWMPLAIAMVCYYAGGISIFGNTPGVCLAATFGRDEPVRTGSSHTSHASASAPGPA